MRFNDTLELLELCSIELCVYMLQQGIGNIWKISGYDQMQTFNSISLEEMNKTSQSGSPLYDPKFESWILRI